MPTRLLTINIRDYLVNQPRRKRPARMMRYVKYKIAQQTNLREENIKISQDLNSSMIKNNLRNMHKLKVSIEIDKDKATVKQFQEKAPAAATTDAKGKSATKNTKTTTPATKTQTTTNTKAPAEKKAIPAAKTDTASKAQDSTNAKS